MSAPLWHLLLVPAAYLLGAIPWGVIIAKLAGGVDVREEGSRSTGMTNVMRTVGVGPAIIVLALDVGKGVLAVMAARLVARYVDLPPAEQWFLEVACAVAALVGHNWSVYLRFRGGRGIATGLGALSVLSPWAGLAALTVALPVMAISRYVSLGSLAGAFLGGGGLVVLSVLHVQPAAYGVYGGIGVVVITFRHRENIRRLLAGTESRLGRRPPPTTPERTPS
jgi:glycerol-3-phosphate acyltransferase PlsY